MMLLTEQEISEIESNDDMWSEDQYIEECSINTLKFARAIEAKVIEKIKAQGAAAWAATSDDETVEALGFNQSRSRFTVPLYRLPEGD